MAIIYEHPTRSSDWSNVDGANDTIAVDGNRHISKHHLVYKDGRLTDNSSTALMVE